MAIKYATVLQLAQTLQIEKIVPFWDNSTNPTLTKENVGTGDNSNTLFYTDQKNVISGTYTFYRGSSHTTTTTITETTDYTFDTETGTITLTGTGVTTVGTETIFAVYSYFALNISNTLMTRVLNRAELEVENLLNTVFTDGTGANPAYPVITKESHASQGTFNRTYFLENVPVKDVESALASNITSSDTSLSVTTGDGTNFPSSGTIIINREIITYTGISTDSLTGLTRGVDDSDAAAHSSTDEVHTTVIESSGTFEGTAPTWTAMKWNSEVFVDPDTGATRIYKDILIDSVYVDGTIANNQGIANRFRATYLHGHDTIPFDIERFTLIIAMEMLVNDTEYRALTEGRNEFKPAILVTTMAEKERIIGSYREISMGNT